MNGFLKAVCTIDEIAFVPGSAANANLKYIYYQMKRKRRHQIHKTVGLAYKVEIFRNR